MNFRSLVGLLLAPLLAIVVMLLPTPEILGASGQRGLSFVALIVVWWITAAFPLPLVALAAVPLSVMMGVLDIGEAISFLGSPTMLIVIGAMLMLGAMEQSGLIERYTYWMVTTEWVKNSPGRLLLVYSFSVGLLSTIMSNIPISVLFTSIAVSLAKSLKAKPGDALPRALVVISGMGANLGGSGTPIGAVPNLVAMGLIAASLQQELEFWQWTVFGLPLACLWLAALAVVCWFFYVRKNDSQSSVRLELFQDRLKALGRMSLQEKLILAVLGLALLGWSAGQPLCRYFGLTALAPYMNTPFIAIAAGCILFFIPTGRNEQGKVKFALDWKSAARALNWDVIIFIAGALLIGKVMGQSHIDAWIGSLVASALAGLGQELVWLALIGLCALLAQIINPVALMPLLVPMSATVASQTGLNPIIVAISVGMMANVSIMFPFSSPPMAAALLGSEKFVERGDFLRVSIPLIILCVFIAWLFGMILEAFALPALLTPIAE